MINVWQPFFNLGSVACLMFYLNFMEIIPMTALLFGKVLFIRFAASAFRKLPSVYVFSYFPFGFEGRVWDLIVSVPDYCLSLYFAIIFGSDQQL